MTTRTAAAIVAALTLVAVANEIDLTDKEKLRKTIAIYAQMCYHNECLGIGVSAVS